MSQNFKQCLDTFDIVQNLKGILITRTIIVWYHWNPRVIIMLSLLYDNFGRNGSTCTNGMLSLYRTVLLSMVEMEGWCSSMTSPKTKKFNKWIQKSTGNSLMKFSGQFTGNSFINTSTSNYQLSFFSIKFFSHWVHI